MNAIQTKSLAQIVNANHRTAYVFEKYNLDFCCKGKRSLKQACEELEIPVDQIISELEVVSSTSESSLNFEEMTLPQLADYIVLTHHDYVKKEIPLIVGYLEKVASKHGARHPEMLKVFNAFIELKIEMERHMEKEEMIVFPRIKMIEKTLSKNEPVQLGSAYLKLPIALMEEEHEVAGDHLSFIRKETKNYSPPVDACTTYRLCYAALQAFELDLHQHVHLENNLLFPKALELFKEITEAELN